MEIKNWRCTGITNNGDGNSSSIVAVTASTASTTTKNAKFGEMRTDQMKTLVQTRRWKYTWLNRAMWRIKDVQWRTDQLSAWHHWQMHKRSNSWVHIEYYMTNQRIKRKGDFVFYYWIMIFLILFNSVPIWTICFSYTHVYVMAICIVCSTIRVWESKADIAWIIFQILRSFGFCIGFNVVLFLPWKAFEYIFMQIT